MKKRMKIQIGGNYYMKIRSDYVTNSSSSSFILSFKDEDSIYNTLKKQFPKYIENGWSAGKNGYLCQLLNEIEKSDRLTKDNIKEIVNNKSLDIRWDIKEELERKGMSYSEVRNFLETVEGKKMIANACKEKFEKIMNKIGDNKVIVQVEHGNGGEGEDGVLENEILPNLDCTAVRFSNH